MFREFVKIIIAKLLITKQQFEGKKKSNGKTDIVKSEWKKVEKDYEYFDPGKSGIVTWIKLIIKTKPL